MDERDRQIIARILKVNHAGEVGAIRIYKAQIAASRWLCPDTIPFLEETLKDEIRHCNSFFGAMEKYEARPCRILGLWSLGGATLGFLSAMLGSRGILVCTAAVESTVHDHMLGQLDFLSTRSSDLFALTTDILREELQHLRGAQERLHEENWWTRVMTRFIALSTEAAIFMSTWGDSAILARNLREAQARANQIPE